jgi:hypothetical protein
LGLLDIERELYVESTALTFTDFLILAIRPWIERAIIETMNAKKQNCIIFVEHF